MCKFQTNLRCFCNFIAWLSAKFEAKCQSNWHNLACCNGLYSTEYWWKWYTLHFKYYILVSVCTGVGQWANMICPRQSAKLASATIVPGIRHQYTHIWAVDKNLKSFVSDANQLSLPISWKFWKGNTANKLVMEQKHRPSGTFLPILMYISANKLSGTPNTKAKRRLWPIWLRLYLMCKFQTN